MKKALAIVIAVVMAAALFSACAREERDEHIEPEETDLCKNHTSENSEDEDGAKKRFRFSHTFRRHRTQSTE
jgi:hypothetical protein